jgi:D-glycerate 3-kinase
MSTSTPLMIDHISSHIRSHLPSSPPSHSPRPPPLFVALQGPQGSGKTYITSLLSKHLSAPPYNLKLATLSLDDLYLPHADLHALKELHPLNRLLAGRGLPGTHDLELGVSVLERLSMINNDDELGEAGEVQLPVFEKSLYNGEGDRLPPSPEHCVAGPLDVVLVEGWCMGFSSIHQQELNERWEGISEEMKRWCGLEHVMQVNEKLEAYEELWRFFDVFIQVGAALFSLFVYVY